MKGQVLTTRGLGFARTTDGMESNDSSRIGTMTVEEDDEILMAEG